MQQHDKIAIIGQSLQFPGAKTIDQFWENLLSAKNIFRPLNHADIGAHPATYFNKIRGTADHYYFSSGGFIDLLSSAQNTELKTADDELSEWSLLVCKNALADAGYDTKKKPGNRCGIIMANLSFPSKYSHRLFQPVYQRLIEEQLSAASDVDTPFLSAAEKTGKADWQKVFFLSNPAAFIAGKLGLNHISFTLDAACASSHYAIHLAGLYLLSGQADTMVVAAVNAAHPLYIQQGFSIFQAFPNEHQVSVPLDNKSQGLIASYGAAALVLKRLSMAIKDNDRIDGIIESSALTNDGSGRFLLVPNSKGQLLALQKAYENSAVKPEQINYIECHATGTPVGDQVEVESMETFFKAHAAKPLLGAVKANIGHLLTVAGMAGIIKCLGIIKHNLIPATAGLTDPIRSTDSWLGKDDFCLAEGPIKPKSPVSHTAVNAFGFGGTNAHLILSKFSVDHVPESNSIKAPLEDSPAIIGMSALFGGCADLTEFYDTVWQGKQHLHPLPKSRWKGTEQEKIIWQSLGFFAENFMKGAFLDTLDLDVAALKIPPLDVEFMQPQQLALLKSADAALLDAGFNRLNRQEKNIAVIVAMETEFALHQIMARWDVPRQFEALLTKWHIHLKPDQAEQLKTLLKEWLYPTHGKNLSAGQFTGCIGNLMASRVSSLWNLVGPSFTISSFESGSYKALDLARQLLAFGQVDAVVVAAVDMAAGFESLFLKNMYYQALSTRMLSLEKVLKFPAFFPGEGAAAVVLMNQKQATIQKKRIYAAMEGLTFTHSAARDVLPKTDAYPAAEFSKEVMVTNFSHAMQAAKISAKDIGYVELDASVLTDPLQFELQAMAEIFCREHAPAVCAVGSVKHNIGHTFAAAGLAAVVKTACCLYRRSIPAVPDRELQKKMNESLPQSLYAADTSRPWFLNHSEQKRLAAVNGLGLDGVVSTLILSAGHVPSADEFIGNCQNQSHFMSLSAADSSGLVSQLNEINALLQRQNQEISLPFCLKTTNSNDDQPLKLALAAENHDKFTAEAAYWLKKISAAGPLPKFQQTPGGSTFYIQSNNTPPKIALVYPGSFHSYPGMAADLFKLFPNLHEDLQNKISNPNQLFFAEDLYPIKRTAASAQSSFYENPVKVMSMGLGLALAHTIILRKYLNLKPQAAVGYSMGECSTMWYANDVWELNQIKQSFQMSDLFQNQLAGKLSLLKEVWGIPAEDIRHYWSSFVLFSPLSLLEPVMAEFDRVFLSFINTDNELVISGSREDCLKCIKIIACRYLELPVPTLVHHDFVRKLYPSLIAMHQLPIQQKPDMDFYSSLTLAPMTMDSHVLAENAAGVCCRTVNFPALIRQAYQDGITVFIEVGPNSVCSRWISEILKNQPHLTVSMDNKALSSEKSLLRVLAALNAYGVDINIKQLIRENSNNPTRSLKKRVVIGGPGFKELLNSKHDPAYFKQNSDKALAPIREKQIIWDENDLLEFAGGKIAKVFGSDFEIIDTYLRRVRLPLPPYLLVSRVTGLNAEPKKFQPSFLQTEYDIPWQAWYATDGQIPWSVAVESGQCDLLLISYLGIDFENKGQRVYRLLDCVLTFLDDLPKEGETLRYDISINSFSKSGDTLLFFFSYNCFVGTKRVLEMRGGCAGFFTDQELDQGQGVIYSKAELDERLNTKKSGFVPLLGCPKTVFSKEDLQMVSAGKLAECFGIAYYADGKNSSLRLPPERILMIDRITSVDRQGGPWGLGEIIAEKDLHPDDWYFPCHFKDDQVLAGSLLAEGAGQLLQFFMLYLGMQRLTKDARFQPIIGLGQQVRTRKQIIPKDQRFSYRLWIKKINLLPRPQVIADAEILMDGMVLVYFKNLGLEIREKQAKFSNPAISAEKNQSAASLLFSDAQLQEFALGSIVKCFGEKFSIYEQQRISRTPNSDLQLMSRVLSSNGRPGMFRGNPQLISEYDVPVNPWFIEDNNSGQIPYSILMEIALQPCGFFSAYLGSTLQFPDLSLFLRNLDGSGTVLKSVDCRGQVIVNTVHLISSVSLAGTILQKFTFELSCHNQVFYKGNAGFGFFTQAMMLNQSGLDNGRYVPPWIKSEAQRSAAKETFYLDAADAKNRFYRISQQKSHYRLPCGQLRLLHQLNFVSGGGEYQADYVLAGKRVQPYDWYFACHFYQDPVMPGSLGVEAMLQALQAYALWKDLGADYADPVFFVPLNHTQIWKYRGQILSHEKEMTVELHIKEIKKTDHHTIVYADASLWNDHFRIYEIKNLALGIGQADKIGLE